MWHILKGNICAGIWLWVWKKKVSSLPSVHPSSFWPDCPLASRWRPQTIVNAKTRKKNLFGFRHSYNLQLTRNRQTHKHTDLTLWSSLFHARNVSKQNQAGFVVGKIFKRKFYFWSVFTQFSILQWIVSNSGQKKNMVW